jgi:hypothetical protein
VAKEDASTYLLGQAIKIANWIKAFDPMGLKSTESKMPIDLL